MDPVATTLLLGPLGKTPESVPACFHAAGASSGRGCACIKFRERACARPPTASYARYTPGRGGHAPRGKNHGKNHGARMTMDDQGERVFRYTANGTRTARASPSARWNGRACSRASCRPVLILVYGQGVESVSRTRRTAAVYLPCTDYRIYLIDHGTRRPTRAARSTLVTSRVFFASISSDATHVSLSARAQPSALAALGEPDPAAATDTRPDGTRAQLMQLYRVRFTCAARPQRQRQRAAPGSHCAEPPTSLS